MYRKRAVWLFVSALILAETLQAATSGTRQRQYPKTFDSVWAAVIGALQGRSYPILLSDKTTGIITTDFKIDEGEEWRHKFNILLVNSGIETSVSVTSTVENQKSNHAIAVLSFGIVRPREWEEEESDGTREAELLQAITTRLQPGGIAVDTAESNCKANFTIRGTVLRGTTYETFEEFPRLPQLSAIDVLNVWITKQSLTIVENGKASGAINTQGRSPNGKPYTLDFIVAPTNDGVRVRIVQKLPAGNRGDDEAVRNDLCQIVGALSLAIPKPLAAPTIASSPHSAPAAGSSSIEDRLRKLDELYKKHLITEDEYKKKRAELLSQL